MKEFKINKKKIGKRYKPFVIVEACVNHQGDFSIAKKMVYFAKKIGADCIKFQHHILNEEMLKEVPKSKNFKVSLWEVIKKTNFTLRQHRELKILCDKIKIEYLCTPFSIKAADELNSIGVRAFKTGSGELTNLPFIEHLAKIGKPIILSTGMSYPKEIIETVKIIKKHKTPFSIMHCVSAYPCPYKIMNLNNINILEKKFGVPIGLSDHTPSIYTSLGAVSLGASLIEKHFTFNKNLSGPDHKSSIDGPELKNLIQGVEANYLARGSLKKIFKEEREIVNWARESVVTIKTIKKGEKLTTKNLSVKRPSPKKGEIPAKFLSKILNKKSNKNLEVNKKIKWIDLK
tara:strand:+ start:666 stop:1700 length:1035 start_codon:yes stop_codon:yes gene_type:complete